MSSIEDPLLVTPQKRIGELKKISNTLNTLPPILREKVLKNGPPDSYITHLQFSFCIANFPYEYWNHGPVLPCGYFSDGIAVIYFPPQDRKYQYQDGDMNAFLRAGDIIRELETFKPKKWILDFRGNTGGVLTTFFNYISPFLPEDFSIPLKSKEGLIDIKVENDIITWNNPSRTVTKTYIVNHQKVHASQIEVFVNHNTASASEFSCYLLKKYNKNIIIRGHSNTSGAITTVQLQNTNIGLFVFPFGEVDDPILKGKKFVKPNKSDYLEF
ncbi:MAG: hypothetical protein CMM93_06700 [Rickettsiales bacterium]|nr:hypothetical protein [Rickettsiales bacterium]|tara:strand:- start:225 stop:1037 length:813 start_codon:yes stop_codon:yes gene_type:complete